MGGVISLYKPTTTHQPKVLGFVWCTLSHRLFTKAMDNQPEKWPSTITGLDWWTGLVDWTTGLTNLTTKMNITLFKY